MGKLRPVTGRAQSPEVLSNGAHFDYFSKFPLLGSPYCMVSIGHHLPVRLALCCLLEEIKLSVGLCAHLIAPANAMAAEIMCHFLHRLGTPPHSGILLVSSRANDFSFFIYKGGTLRLSKSPHCCTVCPVAVTNAVFSWLFQELLLSDN